MVSSHARDYFHFLVNLTDAIIATKDIPHLAEKTADYLHDFSRTGLHQSGNIRLLRLHTACLYSDIRPERRAFPFLVQQVAARHAVVDSPEKSRKNPFRPSDHRCPFRQIPCPFLPSRQGIQFLLHLPLVSMGELLGTLALGSSKYTVLSQSAMELLNRVGTRLAMALDVILSQQEQFHPCSGTAGQT